MTQKGRNNREEIELIRIDDTEMLDPNDDGKERKPGGAKSKGKSRC